MPSRAEEWADKSPILGGCRLQLTDRSQGAARVHVDSQDLIRQQFRRFGAGDHSFATSEKNKHRAKSAQIFLEPIDVASIFTMPEVGVWFLREPLEEAARQPSRDKATSAPTVRNGAGEG